jgi:hypothetical protein
VFFVFCSTNLFSAQYENYKWGISKKEAIQQVKDNGYSIIENGSLESDGYEAICYRDKIFNEKVWVILTFTPKSKKLFGIIIKSKSEYIGSNLKPILEDKYGEPSQPNQFMDKYIWLENGKPSIILEYGFKTTLSYCSIDYFLVSQKEKKELDSKEAKGKF